MLIQSSAQLGQSCERQRYSHQHAVSVFRRQSYPPLTNSPRTLLVHQTLSPFGQYQERRKATAVECTPPLWAVLGLACHLLRCWLAGTATFVHKTWSPIQAQVDCLGSGQDDIDREGRSVLAVLARLPVTMYQRLSTLPHGLLGIGQPLLHARNCDIPPCRHHHSGKHADTALH